MPDPIKLEGDDAAVQIGDDVYTGGDIANLKAGHDANAAKKETIAQQEKDLTETKEKLTKLENKDFNFKKLRDMNDEEKGKLTEAEKALMNKQEELEENQTKFTETIVDGNKNEALAVLVGDDAEMRKKVLYNFDRIKGDAVTKEQISAKMREAHNMLGMQGSQINPINLAAGSYGDFGNISSDNKQTNVDGELAKKLGLDDDDLKNSNLKVK